MADLRKKFLEDYAGGILNVSRQELSSNGEVLSQDGFFSDRTAFVEDGVGAKSALKLGVSLAESLDPVTPTGIVNVRYADRTYTKIRDTKIFTTAMASAQAALAEATAKSIDGIERAIVSLEQTDTTLDRRINTFVDNINSLNDSLQSLEEKHDEEFLSLSERINLLESGSLSTDNNIKFGQISQNSLRVGILNTSLGYASLSNLTQGNDNLAFGTEAGLSLVKGNNNVFIGAGVGSNLAATEVSDQIYLGNKKQKYIKSYAEISNYSIPDLSYDLPLREETREFTPNASPQYTKNKLADFLNSLEVKHFIWEDGTEDFGLDLAQLKQAQDTSGVSGVLDGDYMCKTKLVPMLVVMVQLLEQELVTLEATHISLQENYTQLRADHDQLALYFASLNP